MRSSPRLLALVLVAGAALQPAPGQQAANGQRAADGTCNQALTTAAMLTCAEGQARLADAELNRTYTAVLHAQDAEGRVRLLAAETAWLRYRDAEVAFQVGKVAGGTLAPVLKFTVFTQLTKSRTAQLASL